MGLTYCNPNKNDAQFINYSGVGILDPENYNQWDYLNPNGKYFYKPVQDELLNLIDINSNGIPVIKIKNNNSFTLVSGTVVTPNGFLDDNYTVIPSSASYVDRPPCYLITSGIAANAVGLGYAATRYAGLNTVSYPAGTPVYLSNTSSGSLTFTKPASGRIYNIGYVSEQHSTSGSIVFNSINTPKLVKISDMQDISLTGLADNDGLVWSNSQSKWINSASVLTDQLVKASSSDSTAGYLDAKVDNITIQVSNNLLSIKDGIVNSNISGNALIDWTKINKSGALASDINAANSSHMHSGTSIISSIPLSSMPDNVGLVSLSGDVVLTTSDRNKTYANLNSTLRIVTLPNPSEGEGYYKAYCGHSDGIRINAPSGKRIRFGSNITTADSGFIQSNSTGSYVEFFAIDSTNWVACRDTGTWTITAS